MLSAPASSASASRGFLGGRPALIATSGAGKLQVSHNFLTLAGNSPFGRAWAMSPANTNVSEEDTQPWSCSA